MHSVERVRVCAVYIFVVLKMFCCVGNIARIDAMAYVGPKLDVFLATSWRRFCVLIEFRTQARCPCQKVSIL